MANNISDAACRALASKFRAAGLTAIASYIASGEANESTHTPALEALTDAIRAGNDAAYMLAAVVPMLGPKARQVWDEWQAQGVTRVHFDWGPEGAKMTGEDRAEVHLQFNQASKNSAAIDDIDAMIAERDKRP